MHDLQVPLKRLVEYFHGKRGSLNSRSGAGNGGQMNGTGANERIKSTSTGMSVCGG